MEVLQSRFEVKIIFSNFSYADIHTTDSLSIVLATTDQRRDGCPNATHLFEPNFMKVWTQKLGQRLSIACGVDFVLFKSLYVKIAFIAMLIHFRLMINSKFSAKTASEDCMLFFFKSQFLSMTKCWVYLISTGTGTLCKV